MKSAHIVVLAGLLFAVETVPAKAIWMPVVSVRVGQSATVDVVDASRELPGQVDALSFRANDTALTCQDVTVRYRSGDQHMLWRGMLRAGRTRTIHMVPVHRDVSGIDFNCWALKKPGALDIAADIPGKMR